MVKKRSVFSRIFEICMFLSTLLFHWIIFYFIIITAGKDQAEAAKLTLQMPTEWKFWENIQYVLTFNNGLFIKSFWNSVRLTVCSIAILVFTAAMTAYILQRKKNWLAKVSDKLIIAGLIVPASVIPTYWVLSLLGIANTLTGLTLVEVASLFPFAVMMYKGFIATIPKELDEAAVIDGSGPIRLFFRIIFPMLKPITMAVIILRSIVVYNDFQNPQYFMSGSESQTVQLCIYLFKSSFSTHYGRLMAAVIIVSFPLVVVYIFLNKYIMEGMTTGAVKG